ncbi:hypothetical protein T265_05726 [Opisthorchis viverrini]|uniref:Uncharacterized protein n=1 Tax=Opisthorchis viverrini TaxID=6198 RepID=A0A074ZN87_OPIVI|nr:hypothetical protein T265_05726 [Opisthorchis viverrini]KER27192.1 hypothetical protein T265_05726 [Opisthorchis viverrini]
MRQPAAHPVAWKHHKREVYLRSSNSSPEGKRLQESADWFRQLERFFDGSQTKNTRLTETRGLRLPDEPQEGRNRSWAVEKFSATL